MKKIKIIEANSELGAGTRGASLGIDAIKVASLNKKNDLFTKYPKKIIETHNEWLWEGIINSNAKRIEGVSKVLFNICEGVYQNIVEYFPIVLSGDHSCAAGTIAGIKKAYPDKRLGVIWIDAHADLHTPFTSPSGNIHGMPIAIALAEDNLESQINEPSHDEALHWNGLKFLGIKGAKFSTKDLVFITVRDTEKPENEFIERNKIKNYSYAEIQKKGIEAVARETLNERLKDCDIIYISFDVDSMDSKYSVGTGTPVPDGLSPKEAQQLNQLLVSDKRVCCWEVVEINPLLDTVNKMAENAFDIMEVVINSVIKR